MTLTREEIQGMKPGREMDALIAEKVLGWTDIRRVNPAVIHSFSADGNHANVGFSPVLYKHVPFPLYSREISAAWEVVMHLKSKYWYFMLSDENEGWEASFYWDPHRPAYEALSAEAPQAICKAALLASLKL